ASAKPPDSSGRGLCFEYLLETRNRILVRHGRGASGDFEPHRGETASGFALASANPPDSSGRGLCFEYLLETRESNPRPARTRGERGFRAAPRRARERRCACKRNASRFI